VVQHEGVLKTPLPRARAHVCRDVHIKDRVGNIVHVALGDIEAVVGRRGAGGRGLCVHCGCCCSTAASRCACLRQ